MLFSTKGGMSEGRLATLEARGRVHFCCSNDLKEKNLFDAIAIENGVEKCFKTCLKVCTKGLVSYFSFFLS